MNNLKNRRYCWLSVTSFILTTLSLNVVLCVHPGADVADCDGASGGCISQGESEGGINCDWASALANWNRINQTLTAGEWNRDTNRLLWLVSRAVLNRAGGEYDRRGLCSESARIEGRKKPRIESLSLAVQALCRTVVLGPGPGKRYGQLLNKI